MFKIRNEVDLKDKKVVKKLYQCGLHYEWLLNGKYEIITVVKNKNKPLDTNNFVKEFNPNERFDCDELIIFLSDENKTIQFKNGYNKINSEVFKKMQKADLVEKVEDKGE